MVFKPPRPRDVTLLSANLLAGTVGVAGLGVGPRNREQPLPAHCTEPRREIEGWEGLHGGPSPTPGWGHKTHPQPSVCGPLTPFGHRPEVTEHRECEPSRWDDWPPQSKGSPHRWTPGVRTGAAPVSLGKLTPGHVGCTNY